MAGLDDLNNPTGKSMLSKADDDLRLIVTKLLEFAGIEHYNTGEHKFGRGTVGNRPAYGNAGRIYILEATGVAVELQYDTGSAWANITQNATIAGVVASLAAHSSAATIDHPNESVTSAKIAGGAILKKHLLSGGGDTSVNSLVNGGTCTLHTHYPGVGAGYALDSMDADELTTGVPQSYSHNGLVELQYSCHVHQPGNYWLGYDFLVDENNNGLYDTLLSKGATVDFQVSFCPTFIHTFVAAGTFKVRVDTTPAPYWIYMQVKKYNSF